MEEKDEKIVDHVFNTDVISFDIAQKDRYELDLQGKFEVVLREGKYYVERIKPQYPKTYEECFNICFGNKHHIVQVVGLDDLGDNKELFESFIKLKICRDAYWKIAGDWKPNWKDFSTQKYSISVDKDDIILSQRVTGSRIFVFPTAEMRDAFYENFKDLIEKCKELL